MSNGKRLVRVACFLCAAFFTSALFAAEKAVMAVVSVDAKRSSSVYDEIIDGIKAQFSGTVKVYKLKADFSEQDLLQTMQSDGVDIVTALGNKSQNVASVLASHYPVLVGAVPAVLAKGVGGVTMMPSSTLIIDRLRTLAPDINNLYLVYRPGLHDETVTRIENTAKKYGIKVIGMPSSDSNQTQAAIEKTLKNARNGSDNPRNALWILWGTRFPKSSIEHLIRESWGQPVIPFNYVADPRHIDRFPFIFLPDWPGMGQQLAGMAQNRLNGAGADVLPLENIKLWVNRKKSRHYGLKLDGESRKKIDNVYNR